MLGRLTVCQLCGELIRRRLKQIRSQVTAILTPHGQVVQQLFSADGGAVVAHQERRRNGVVIALDHLFIDAGEQHLAARRSARRRHQ